MLHRVQISWIFKPLFIFNPHFHETIKNCKTNHKS